jgi:membrane dipeptidase
VIDEMNRTGVMVDLSHVGPKTTEDARRHSKKPVAFTHCCPTGIMEHPRNKTDAQLRLVADPGGFVGVATYPPFLPWGDETTVHHCIAVFDYMMNIMREDNVGIGTDFTQDQDVVFFRWLRGDKGTGRALTLGEVKVTKPPSTLSA